MNTNADALEPPTITCLAALDCDEFETIHRRDENGELNGSVQCRTGRMILWVSPDLMLHRWDVKDCEPRPVMKVTPPMGFHVEILSEKRFRVVRPCNQT